MATVDIGWTNKLFFSRVKQAGGHTRSSTSRCDGMLMATSIVILRPGGSSRRSTPARRPGEDRSLPRLRRGSRRGPEARRQGRAGQYTVADDGRGEGQGQGRIGFGSGYGQRCERSKRAAVPPRISGLRPISMAVQRERSRVPLLRQSLTVSVSVPVEHTQLIRLRLHDALVRPGSALIASAPALSVSALVAVNSLCAEHPQRPLGAARSQPAAPAWVRPDGTCPVPSSSGWQAESRTWWQIAPG